MPLDESQSGQLNWEPWKLTSSQEQQSSHKALVNFLAEWRQNQIPAPHNVPEHWVMYFDGSLKLDGGSAGVLFISLFQILFKVSNNEAEYEALLHGLRLVVSLGIKRLLTLVDSLSSFSKLTKNGTSTRT